MSDASNIARAVQEVPYTSLEHTHFTTTLHAYWTGTKLRHSLTFKLRSILGRNVKLDVGAMQQVPLTICRGLTPKSNAAIRLVSFSVLYLSNKL